MIRAMRNTTCEHATALIRKSAVNGLLIRLKHCHRGGNRPTRFLKSKKVYLFVSGSLYLVVQRLNLFLTIIHFF